jgi:hypothetical protein
VLREHPVSITNGKVCLVEMVPDKPLCTVVYGEQPPLGTFILRDLRYWPRPRRTLPMVKSLTVRTGDRQTIGAGIVKSIEWADDGKTGLFGRLLQAKSVESPPVTTTAMGTLTVTGKAATMPPFRVAATNDSSTHAHTHAVTKATIQAFCPWTYAPIAS